MSNLPLVNLHIDAPDNLSSWLEEVKPLIHEVDWQCLITKADEPEGFLEFYGMYANKFHRGLSYYALVPLFPKWFVDKIEKGDVILYEKNLEAPAFWWADKFDLEKYNVDSVDLEGGELPDLKGKTLLVHPPLGGKHLKTINSLTKAGAKPTTLSHLHAESVAQTDVSVENVIQFVRCMGAKYATETEEWVLIPCRDVTIKIKYIEEERVWQYREEDGKAKKTRLFYGINGLVPTSNNTIFLLALAYIVQGSNRKDIQGRRAFLANVFQDEVNVGFSHDILDEFLPRKLGTLQLGVNPIAWTLDVGKDADYMSVVQAYESNGFSSFVHKGGKYAVIEAECTGFTRLPNTIDKLVQTHGEDEQALRDAVMALKKDVKMSPQDFDTFIAWLADKLPKYTGRALWLVPTAAQMLGSGEKGLNFEDVADFINSF